MFKLTDLPSQPFCVLMVTTLQAAYHLRLGFWQIWVSFAASHPATMQLLLLVSPACTYNHSSLWGYLYIDNNTLTGTIPSEIGLLTNFCEFYCHFIWLAMRLLHDVRSTPALSVGTE